MKYSKIIGTGSYLPEKIVTNADLEKIVDTTDEWIMKRVGIRERHMVADSGETTCSMAAEAAKRALEVAQLTPNDIQMIVVGTASPDFLFPSAACIIQERLKIDNDCIAFDINAACAGFIYSLSTADQFIKSGKVQNALVIGVDTLSTVIDWTDRSTCVLFGDGAGAVVLQANSEPGILATEVKAAGKYANLLYSKSALWDKEDPGKLRMDGHEVFRIAVTKLGEIAEEIVQKAGLKQSDVDWMIPHQANLRIITATAKRLGLPLERVILTIEEHGNTSAASIPLALDHAVRKGKIKRGENLLLEAFGAGFAWGAALIKY
jgi:3-oxoacyl-[acyl-carrier-protein] synthase-3